MNKTYIRPTVSVEQCEAKAGFSLNYSSSTTGEAWTKQGAGATGSFDTSSLWDTEW